MTNQEKFCIDNAKNIFKNAMQLMELRDDEFDYGLDIERNNVVHCGKWEINFGKSPRARKTFDMKFAGHPIGFYWVEHQRISWIKE